MESQQILGAVMIVMVFAGIFVFCARELGVRDAIGILASAFALSAWLIVGATLLKG